MSSSPTPPPMLMLLLVNGLTPTELSSSLDKLKNETKNIGTHNLRQLYYKSYQDIQKDISKYSTIDDINNGGKLYGLVKYYRNYGDNNNNNDDDDSTAKTEFEEFTKRQKALVNTPKVFMGRHIRLLVDDNDNDSPPTTTNNEFFMPWFGKEAEIAYLDITSGEECISIDSDRGVYISTRIKRKNCGKPPSSVLKSIDGLIDYITNQLQQPDKPLQSIAWNGHNIPIPNSYNVILTGTHWPNSIIQHLPKTNIAGYTNTTSMYEIYDLFEQCRNIQYINEAESLISKMLTEIAKQQNDNNNSTSVYTGSMKDLVCAKRNSLLKKVYIDSSKTKFIQNNAKNDGNDNGFELIVVHSRKGSDIGQFEEYGGIVFELFYKLDLSIYG